MPQKNDRYNIVEEFLEEQRQESLHRVSGEDPDLMTLGLALLIVVVAVGLGILALWVIW